MAKINTGTGWTSTATPPGPPGFSTSMWPYLYSTGSYTNPAVGCVCPDQVPAEKTTEISVHRYDRNGTDNRVVLLTIRPGQQVITSDSTDSNVWATFTVTAPPEDHTDYITFPVRFTAKGTVTATVGHVLLFGFSGPEPSPLGGGTVQDLWVWLAPATSATVGATRIGVNNDAPSQATECWIHKEAKNNNIDYSATISKLVINNHVQLQTKSNATSFHQYRVTALPSLQGGTTWKIPVITETGSAVGTEPQSGTDVLVTFQF